MSQMNKFVLLGGDDRQYYLADYLHRLSYPVAVYGLDLKNLSPFIYQAASLKEALSFGNNIIGPIPFANGECIRSKTALADLTIHNLLSLLTNRHQLFGGCIPDSVQTFCKDKQITVVDLMKEETISIANAVATAEGAIVEAMLRSPLTLHHNNSLILGFGRCAQILASKLLGLNSFVTVAARKKEALAYANAYGYQTVDLKEITSCLGRFSFIFNTIPAMVLDESSLSYVSKDAAIIDLASAPGGVNYDYCNQIHLNASLCLGLPGKYAPKTSATLLGDAILASIHDDTSS